MVFESIHDENYSFKLEKELRQIQNKRTVRNGKAKKSFGLPSHTQGIILLHTIKEQKSSKMIILMISIK